jgi:hypothetical protein
MAQQAINIVLDGPPGPEAGRFVEVETDGGASISIGEWIERPDGWWALRITELPNIEPTTTAAKMPKRQTATPNQQERQMREYEMTDEQLAKLQDASKSVPLMKIGDYLPRTTQEKANDVWQALGKEMGFDFMSVRPAPGKGDRFFTAEPTEPVNA